jgi:hypothetical protein
MADFLKIIFSRIGIYLEIQFGVVQNDIKYNTGSA